MLTYVFGFSGEIPVALLRLKFVENRTVELKETAGLVLPYNIGELGDSVTKIDLSDHNLRGGLSARTKRLRIWPTFFTLFTGTLPKTLGKLVNLIVFDVSVNKLRGGLSTRTELYQNWLLILTRFAQALSPSRWTN